MENQTKPQIDAKQELAKFREDNKAHSEVTVSGQLLEDGTVDIKVQFNLNGNNEEDFPFVMANGITKRDQVYRHLIEIPSNYRIGLMAEKSREALIERLKRESLEAIPPKFKEDVEECLARDEETENGSKADMTYQHITFFGDGTACKAVAINGNVNTIAALVTHMAFLDEKFQSWLFTAIDLGISHGDLPRTMPGGLMEMLASMGAGE